MTMAKPKEHALSKKLRKIADKCDSIQKPHLLFLATQLDQTIASLGIWRDPERIKTTNAYRQVDRAIYEYERLHP